MIKLIGLGLWNEKSIRTAFLLTHIWTATRKKPGKKYAIGTICEEVF